MVDNDKMNKIQKIIEKKPINESFRLIKTHTSGKHTAKVYKDSDVGEHCVKFYTDGVHHSKADYHTDDSKDAHDTAKYELKRLSTMKETREEVENVDEATQSADTLRPAAMAVDDPMSKMEVISKAIGAMHAASKEDLVKWYNDTIAQFGPNRMPGAVDNSAKNQSSIDMKASAAQATVGPKTADPMPTLSVKEDVEEMFNGQELSEEFKDRAAVLFEAAVTARTLLEQARLEEEFETKLVEEIEGINEDLVKKLDSYLDYVVETWMKENEVAIESTLRNELTNEFIDGLKNLFVEHYIEIPEDKIDVVESLANKVDELEGILNEQIEENTQLKDQFVEVERQNVLEQYVTDLAMSQQEKFRRLAEGVDFDGDLEIYSKKLGIIKESYFTEKKTSYTSTNIDEETFESETNEKAVVTDPMVNRYVQAISKTIKK